MKKSIIGFLIIAFLLLACEPSTSPSPMPVIANSPTSIVGNLYYVSPSGSDANSGTSASPWKTIQKAINTVPSGTKSLPSVIVVKSGSYSERPVVLASKSYITLLADGIVTVRGFHIARNVGTVIDGFDISSTSSVYVEGFGVWVQGSECVIRNNNIHDVSWGGILLLYYTSKCQVYGNRMVDNISLVGIDVRGNDHLIENNEIADVQQRSPYLQSPPSYADADGIHFHGNNIVLRGNYIHDIPYDGVINVDTHTDCFQTFDGLTEQPKAVNAIIDSNRCENVGAVSNEILTKGVQAQGAVNLTIINNTLCAAVGMRIASGSTFTAENNYLCGSLALPASVVSDCMQFESSSGKLNGNSCNNFSSWAIRLDSSPNVSGGGNLAINTKIRVGTEYLFSIPVTVSPTLSPTKTPTSTATPTLTYTPTVTATKTVIVPPSPTATKKCVKVMVGDQYVGDYCY